VADAPKLHVVPAVKPTAKEQTALRIKRMPRPDGLLQCNRCGSRTVLNTENGVTVKNGRRRAGTKIDKDVCADCYKRGVIVPMQTELKPID
jgi:hypothetical protein